MDVASLLNVTKQLDAKLSAVTVPSVLMSWKAYLRKTSSRPSVSALTSATGKASLMLNSPSMVSLAIFTMSTADLQ